MTTEEPKPPNCNLITELPSSSVYLDEISTHYLVFVIIACVLTALIIAIFLEELYYMLANEALSKWKLRDKALTLLGLYPVYAITATVGLLIPRAAALGDLVSNLYLSVAVYVFLVMLIGHYGGKEEMVSHLAKDEINPRVPPCCCCCVCIPNFQVRKRNIVILEILVLQYAFIKPFIQYISLILILDNREYYESDSVQSQFLSWTTTISTLIAMWANQILYRMSAEPLNHVSIKGKFRCLQMVLFATNFQKSILGLLASVQAITCEWPLDVTASVARIQHLLVVIEMFLLAILARIYYRKDPKDSIAALENNPHVHDSFKRRTTQEDDSTGSGSAIITTEPVADRSSRDTRNLVPDDVLPLDLNDVQLEQQKE